MNYREMLDLSKEAVMERMGSRDCQGCLPVDQETIINHTALFNQVPPELAREALIELIDEGKILHNPYSHEVTFP